MPAAVYSVIIPVYNSEHSLEELIKRTTAVFMEQQLAYEIICVNDCSTDNSWNLLNKIKQQQSTNLTLINLSRNCGQHVATLCGLMQAQGTFMITLDDDLQISPEDIPLLIEKMEDENADMVYGVFPQKQHSTFRNMGSRFIAYLLKKSARYQGGGSSFKLISKPLADKIAQARFEYIFLDELIAWHTNNIAYATVRHQARQDGRSGYSFFKLLGMSFKIILNYTLLPLRLMIYTGLVISLICFSLGIYYIYQKLTYGAELGFTSIIVAISFSTGIILFSLGIIGEYLRRLYFTQLYKPPFTIKEIIK